MRIEKGITMYLKRDIYEKLLLWKNQNTGRVLELEGARQVGKTFILEKYPDRISWVTFMKYMKTEMRYAASLCIR